MYLCFYLLQRNCVLGSDLITGVYNELSTNSVTILVVRFNFGGRDETDDDTIRDLVIHMTRTYCQMRGKDFVRQYMRLGFKNKNLGRAFVLRWQLYLTQR